MPYVDLNTIHTPSTGAVIPAAWGDQLRENEEFLIDPPACSIYASDNTTVQDNTDTTLSCDTDNFDNDAMWSGSGSAIDINTPGLYMVICTIRFQAWPFGMRQIKFKVNDTTFYESSLILASAATNSTVLTGIRFIDFDRGDQVETVCRHIEPISGGSLDVQVYEFAAQFQTRSATQADYLVAYRAW